MGSFSISVGDCCCEDCPEGYSTTDPSPCGEGYHLDTVTSDCGCVCKKCVADHTTECACDTVFDDGTGHKFLVRTDTWAGSNTDSTGTQTGSATQTLTVELDCSVTVVWSGSYSYTYDDRGSGFLACTGTVESGSGSFNSDGSFDGTTTRTVYIEDLSHPGTCVVDAGSSWTSQPWHVSYPGPTVGPPTSVYSDPC